MPLELEVDNLDDLDVFQSTVESLKKIKYMANNMGLSGQQILPVNVSNEH